MHAGLSLKDAIKNARAEYATRVKRKDEQSQCVRACGVCVWSIANGVEQHGVDMIEREIGAPFVMDTKTLAAIKKASAK